MFFFYYFVIRKFNTICDWSTITNEMLKRNELCGNQVEHKIQKCLAKGKNIRLKLHLVIVTLAIA